MINVEDEFRLHSKQLVPLHEENQELKGRISRLEEIITQAFPSTNEKPDSHVNDPRVVVRDNRIAPRELR